MQRRRVGMGNAAFVAAMFYLFHGKALNVRDARRHTLLAAKRLRQVKRPCGFFDHQVIKAGTYFLPLP